MIAVVLHPTRFTSQQEGRLRVVSQDSVRQGIQSVANFTFFGLDEHPRWLISDAQAPCVHLRDQASCRTSRISDEFHCSDRVGDKKSVVLGRFT